LFPTHTAFVLDESLLGKITVIKTLALPKLIHLLTSLPNLSQTKINDLNSLTHTAFLLDEFILNQTPRKKIQNIQEPPSMNVHSQLE
jgi:hypothetical protein